MKLIPSGYTKNCSTCHSDLPKLNDTGIKFLKAGRTFAFAKPAPAKPATPPAVKPAPKPAAPAPKPAPSPVENLSKQWAAGKHAQIVEEGPNKKDWPSNRGGTYNCAKCHASGGFKAYITDVKAQETTFKAVYNGNSITIKPYGPYPDAKAVAACDACHDNGKLRITGVVGLQTTAAAGKPGSDKPLMTVNAGKAAACFICHDYRKSPSFPATIDNTARISGPHAAAQTQLLLGFGGAEVAGERYESSPHSAIPNSCVTCHMAKSAGMANHSFKPGISACASCHPGLDTFNRQAFGDYDGDKSIEGIQDEVHGLIAALNKLIGEKLKYPNAKAVSTGGQIIIFADAKHTDPKDPATVSLTHVYENGRWNTDITKPYWTNPDAKKIYNALFNIFFVEEEGSFGIHNPVYAVQLLQKSYKDLAGSDVPGARIR